jgi:hypothetical protein
MPAQKRKRDSLLDQEESSKQQILVWLSNPQPVTVVKLTEFHRLAACKTRLLHCHENEERQVPAQRRELLLLPLDRLPEKTATTDTKKTLRLAWTGTYIRKDF